MRKIIISEGGGFDKVLEFNNDRVVTCNEYWECECESSYIHNKNDSLVCDICGCEEGGSADARLSDISSMLNYPN